MLSGMVWPDDSMPCNTHRDGSHISPHSCICLEGNQAHHLRRNTPQCQNVHPLMWYSSLSSGDLQDDCIQNLLCCLHCLVSLLLCMCQCLTMGQEASFVYPVLHYNAQSCWAVYQALRSPAGLYWPKHSTTVEL